MVCRISATCPCAADVSDWGSFVFEIMSQQTPHLAGAADLSAGPPADLAAASSAISSLPGQTSDPSRALRLKAQMPRSWRATTARSPYDEANSPCRAFTYSSAHPPRVPARNQSARPGHGTSAACWSDSRRPGFRPTPRLWCETTRAEATPGMTRRRRRQFVPRISAPSCAPS